MYSNYRLNIDRMVSLLRKHKKIPRKDNYMESVRKGLLVLYVWDENLVNSVDCLIHSQELHWLNSGKTVYYPESMEQAAAMLTSRSSIKTQDALYNGIESFILTFPSGLNFEAKTSGKLSDKTKVQDVSAMMVTLCPALEYDKLIMRRLAEMLGHPGLHIEKSGDWKEGDLSLSIVYEAFDPSMGATIYYRIHNKLTFFLDVYSCNSFDDYYSLVERTNHFDYYGGEKANINDLRAQWWVNRYVANFLVYKKALPHRISPGLPGHMKKPNLCRNIHNINPRMITMPQGHTRNVAGHYRRMHFRQLMDDRYYKNENAKYKKGSRIILVRDSYVGAKIEANTILSD